MVVAGRRLAPLQTVAAGIIAAGGRALAVACDVGSQESVQALFAATKAEFGRLDILFNNAGFGVGGYLLEDLPLEEWKSVVDTNLTGARAEQMTGSARWGVGVVPRFHRLRPPALFFVGS